MADVFLSYAHQDKDVARQIKQAFSEAGISAWTAHDDIPAGDSWVPAIQKALQEADVMIVIFSEDSLRSTSMAAEWGYFIRQNKFIVPVRVNNIRMPYQLARYTFIDATQDVESALPELIQTVQHILAHPGESRKIRPAKRHVTITFDVDPEASLSDIITRINHLDGNTRVQIQDNMNSLDSEKV